MPDLPPLPALTLPSSSRAVFRAQPPARVVAVLRRARAAEQGAAGEQRIPAFRITRSLIAGTRSAGYTNAQVAACLGMTVTGVRARGGSDGWIAAEDFAELADLPIDTIERWAETELLPHAAADAAGQRYYLASELMRALVGLAAR